MRLKTPLKFSWNTPGNILKTSVYKLCQIISIHRKSAWFFSNNFCQLCQFLSAQLAGWPTISYGHHPTCPNIAPIKFSYPDKWLPGHLSLPGQISTWTFVLPWHLSLLGKQPLSKWVPRQLSPGHASVHHRNSNNFYHWFGLRLNYPDYSYLKEGAYFYRRSFRAEMM